MPFDSRSLMQWLHAKLKAATTRRDQAAREVGRLSAAIDERQAEKRPRTTAADRPPNWDKYKDYDVSTFLRLEGIERENACASNP